MVDTQKAAMPCREGTCGPIDTVSPDRDWSWAARIP